MNAFRLILLLAWLVAPLMATAQQQVSGKVTDTSETPLVGVNIFQKGYSQGTITNNRGEFSLPVFGENPRLVFSFVGFEPMEFLVDSLPPILRMVSSETLLKEVEVVGTEEDVETSSTPKISAKSAQLLPSAFGEFSQVLATLPGVANNSELSATYSVRGGNFDENLVYVNDIPVYRPFLANSGRQEGLSFINTDLVRNISFYAGGWAPKYGDKLSSSLNIRYSEPQQTEGKLTVGLLGGAAYFGGKIPKARTTLAVGFRHRDSRYLLNTLEVDGQYFPTFTDIQAFSSTDLTSTNQTRTGKTVLSLLISYARNRYLTEPASLRTEFGSVLRNFRIETAFEGRELLDYDTFQGGAKLTTKWNNRFKSSFIISGVRTMERENFDVEGAYRLCDVDNDPSSGSFEDCVVIRGVGTNYNFGRNELAANILDTEVRNAWLLNDMNNLEFGVGWSHQEIEDQINEFSFIDSADFVTVNESIFNRLAISANQFTGYIQNTTFVADSSHIFTYGLRFNYRDRNRELLFSPRVQYLFRWSSRTNLRLAAGIYSQPPFYRELRSRSGQLVDDLLGQKSLHLIAGLQQTLTFWGRDFILTGEIYHKELWDVVAYDVENIRLRYFANNNTMAYAQGVDLRINGEFIKGAQSWFSVGILRTMENLPNDGLGFIRRPTDQRVNIGSYFEDHLPGDPSLRVYFNLNIGSGYPFGPPDFPQLRNAFSGDEYYRVDLGLSKEFSYGQSVINSLIVRLEMLNALAADNTLSYTWIEDVTGATFAVPNSLSARFLNVKVTTKF